LQVTENKYITNFVGRTEEQILVKIRGLRCRNSVKVHFKEVGSVDVD
jgi:hypothetical protein